MKPDQFFSWKPAEPSDSIIKLEGDAFTIGDDGEASERVAYFKAQLLRLDCHEPEFVFDDTAEMWEVYQHLYDSESGTPSKALLEALGCDEFELGSGLHMSQPDLLYLETLQVPTKHRGHGYGLNVLRAVIQRYAPREGFVAMMPWPLQFGNEESREWQEMNAEWKAALALDELRTNTTKAKAHSKLARLYRSLGFKPVKGSDYMVRPSWDLQRMWT